MIKYIRFSEVEDVNEMFEILYGVACEKITNQMGIEQIIKVLIDVFDESILDYVDEYFYYNYIHGELEGPLSEYSKYMDRWATERCSLFNIQNGQGDKYGYPYEYALSEACEEYLPDLLSRNLEDAYFAILKEDGLELEENDFLQNMSGHGCHIYKNINGGDIKYVIFRESSCTLEEVENVMSGKDVYTIDTLDGDYEIIDRKVLYLPDMTKEKAKEYVERNFPEYVDDIEIIDETDTIL